MTAVTPPDACVIGICTFRRASLADTLGSLAAMKRPVGPVVIIVADNDDTPSAAAAVARIAEGHPLPIRYIHAPARNISIARNAILDAARESGARYLAYLDDDETASAEWLCALHHEMARCGAAAVVGPVLARYEADAPDWMQRGAVHDTRPVLDPAGTVREAYTSNVLIELQAAPIRGLRFDLQRGRTGGEDTAFFRHLQAAGGVIGYAPTALAFETVPAERASLSWLLRRRYRMGQTHASLLARRSGLGRLSALALAGAKAGTCCALAGLRAFDPLRRNQALIRGALHLGAMAELLGLTRVEPYGAVLTSPGTHRSAGTAK